MRTANPPFCQPTEYMDVPSDPSIPLTDEQLRFLFAGDVRGFITEIHRLGLEAYGREQANKKGG